MTTLVYNEEESWIVLVEQENGVIIRRYWRDDPLNEDGSKPENWYSGEEKAYADANGGKLGCC